MLDSKNVIWLGSFFSLLFITFCVSKNLDDLNPHITNVQKEHDILVTEDNSIPCITPAQNSSQTLYEKDTNNSIFVNDVKIEEISSIPKKEEKEKLHIEKRDKVDENVTLPTTFIDPKIKAKTPKDAKEKNDSKTIKKPTPIKEKVIKKKIVKKVPKATSKTTYKTIKEIDLNSNDIEKILDDRDDNEINKIAFFYSINKNSIVIINSSNLVLAKRLKMQLIKKGVKNIKIKRDKNSDTTTLKLLKERNR